MSFPEDMLEIAEELANRDPNRPKQASLRRAISTAYYALFHLLVQDSASRLVPGADNDPLRNLVSRAFNHGSMKELCLAYAKGTAPDALQAIGATVPPNLRTVANASSTCSKHAMRRTTISRATFPVPRLGVLSARPGRLLPTGEPLKTQMRGFSQRRWCSPDTGGADERECASARIALALYPRELHAASDAPCAPQHTVMTW